MNVEILPIPALKDNYIWALVNKTKHCCVIVDPGSAKPVLDFLKTHELKLSAILVTHHHWDHTDGISEIIQHHPATVFGPALENIPHCTHKVSEPQTVHLSELELTLQVINTPGHTMDHICYYGMNSLFCGDTLFTGGCGRAFEGTPEQLYHSLEKLAMLPDKTQIYCGHEYTQKNLEFALGLEDNNLILRERLKFADEQRDRGLPTVPSTLGIEKETNPFLRCHLDSIRKAAETASGRKLSGAKAVFEAIRDLKNRF